MPCSRADLSVITPFAVEIIAIPRPPITLGSSLTDLYERRLGLLTRFIDSITDLPLKYFSSIINVVLLVIDINLLLVFLINVDITV